MKTKIKELREIAEKRTKGKWYSGNLCVYLGTSGEVDEVLYEAENGPNACEENNDFIATIANHIDELLEIVEEMKWISGVPQNAILEAPEVWGHILTRAKEVIEKLESK